MRALFGLFIASLLAAPAALADEGVLVKSFSVVVGGQEIRIAEASMSRDFLLSWTENRNESREITLQPLTAEGLRGPARRFSGCTLGSASAIGPTTVGSVTLLCRS